MDLPKIFYNSNFSNNFKFSNETTRTENDTNHETMGFFDWTCGKYGYIIRYLVAIYPAYIRFAQCIRRFQDSPKSRKGNEKLENVIYEFFRV